jgi:hypothetical protein
MSIGNIVWPKDASKAVAKYLKFCLLVLEKFNIEFPRNELDPILITQAYIDGAHNDIERRAVANAWWSIIDESGAIRDLKSRDALIARFAIALLTPTEADANELGDHLSWFLELVYFFGEDAKLASKYMKAFFELE